MKGIPPAEVRQIVRDAYIYGFPVVDSYRIQHSYFVDRTNREYKGAWNVLHSVARVFTPKDKAVQTPNSDTPYSFMGMDLRAEPLVISVPAVPKERYYSLQFIDLYTQNFAYVGSRATGSDAGNYLLAGPDWNGESPAGIQGVIRCESQLAFLVVRTQLFGDNDLEAVKGIQAGYKVQPLSAFLGKPAPPAPAPIGFIEPLSPEAQKSDPAFFDVLNFMLGFAPTHPSEVALMASFARIGVGRGLRFDFAALPAEQQVAVKQGMADAWQAFAEFKANYVDTGKRSSADCFGTREFLQNNYMDRMAGAVLGIYGNSRDEAIYPLYFVDAEGKPLNGKSNRYALRFAPGQLPPVHAFWSLTMYELPASLLTENPLNRYLINSPMLKDLVKDADGGYTLSVQHESPGGEREKNWLPAPAGPFFAVLREYWPKAEALDGTWKVPPMNVVKG